MNGRMVDRQALILRGMNPDQRLSAAAALREANLRLLEAGIRSREGRLSASRMRLRVLAHVLPRGLFTRFYGSA
ncbi:MAG: hypothetical protein HZB91_03195 [Elusimicrobia bacterium]|nr:hypothetical protein [Elusimicrobiota bacterium]